MKYRGYVIGTICSIVEKNQADIKSFFRVAILAAMILPLMFV